MPRQSPICLRIAVSLPIKETFSYAVPRDMAAIAGIGCRVLVPFNNRTVTGYILGKSPADPHQELKEILEVLDPEPLFFEKMVPFFEWMADYYIHPVGRIIQSALPGGLNGRCFKTARLTERGLEVLERLPAHYEDSRLLQHIRENPGKPLPSSPVRLESFRKRGWLTIENRTDRKRVGPLMRKFVRLRNGIDLQAFLTANGSLLRAKNEWEFLETVSSGPGALLSDLSSAFTNGAYLTSKWVRKGLLTCRCEAVYRNPAGEMVLPSPAPVELHEQQQVAVNHIRSCLDKHRFSACLLFGVTGSGKTEVYFQAIKHTLALGRQAILMVPEIALAVYMAGHFRSRLGEKVVIYHSGLSRGERYDQWMRMIRGDADLVIGARSALFAPLPALGLIIVDEEHDVAYKQDTNPRYQARDVAVVRAKMEKAVVVLGSGTPSVQSFQNSRTGRYELLQMPQRVERRPLPDVSIINMKASEGQGAVKGILSPELRQAIALNLEAGNQTLLFLNRRGFHRLYICRSCGKPVSCPNCDVALTHHLKDDRLICHYCGFYSDIHMKCPACGYSGLRAYGFGTQKLEQKLEKYFPDARIARMDTDSTRRKGQTFEILKRFSEHQIDILVGTQMITKGYDFPMVTLVGVIAADLSLGFPDFRAGERTFQILSQVAGRAGRGDQRGQVIVQTFNPDHYAISAATGHDFHQFFEKERDLRKQLGYPPFSHLGFLRIQGNSRERTAEAAQTIGQNINGILGGWPKRGKEVLVLGPVEAPIARLKGKYRWQLLLKSKSATLLRHLLNEVAALSKGFLQSRGVRLITDIDPYQMT